MTNATSSARRTSLETRPWRTSIVAGLALTGLLAIGVVGWEAVSVLRSSKEGRAGINRALKPPVHLPRSAPALLVLRDANRQVVGVAVATPPHGGLQASLNIVPASARLTATDGTQSAIRAATDAPGGIANAAAGLLGIEFVSVVEVERRTLEPGLSLASQVALDTLFTRSEGTDELVSLAKREAAWTTILSSAHPADELPAAIFAELNSAGPPVVRAIGGVVAGATIELDASELFLAMAESAPGAVSPASNQVRFEIRDPFHDRAVRQELIARLAFVGASIIWVREVDETPTLETQIGYDNPGRKGEVERYGPVVGEVVVGLSDQPVDNVDATLTIGRDFVDSARREITKRSGSATTVGTIATSQGSS